MELRYLGPVGEGDNNQGLLTVYALQELAVTAEGVPTATYLEEVIDYYTKPSTANGGAVLQTERQVALTIQGYPTLTEVQSLAGQYFQVDQLGVPTTGTATGLATTHDGLHVDFNQVDMTLVADQVQNVYSVFSGDGQLTFTGTAVTGGVGTTAVRLAYVTVPDQGHDWIALPFATVWGFATDAAAAQPYVDLSLQTGTAASLMVLNETSADGLSYGAGYTGGRWWTSPTQVFPNAPASSTVTGPLQPLSGAVTFGLYASLSVGSGVYTFFDQQLDFYVMAFPHQPMVPEAVSAGG